MNFTSKTVKIRGFPGGSDDKKSTHISGDMGSIPGSGRSPGEGNGNPLQYSCWRIPWTVEPGGLYSPRGCKELRFYLKFYLKKSKNKAKKAKVQTHEKGLL